MQLRRTLAMLGSAVTVAVAGLLAVPPSQALVPVTFDSQMWQVNGRVRKIVQTDTAIYLGGSFTALIGPGGQTLARRNAAALDPVTGAPLPFDPSPDATVFSIATSPDGASVYLGGDFKNLGTTSRIRAAKVDATTGAVDPAWNPKPNGRLEAIAPLGQQVFLGGSFTKLGTTARTRLASVSATTAAPSTVWAANADDVVHDIEVSADLTRVLIGGRFARVNGAPLGAQRKLASLDPVTGALQPWADHPSYEVYDIDTTHNQVFAAAGGSGGHAMAYDIRTGKQQWIQFGDGDAVGVAHSNGVVYIGGHFNKWINTTAGHAVAVQATTGQVLPWTIKLNTPLGAFAVDAHKGHVAFGGDFTKVRGIARQRFVRFSEPADVAAPSAPGQPTATATSATAVDLSWSPSTDDIATTIAYRVYRDGGTTPVAVATGTGTATVSATDSGLLPGSTHTYTVVADDGENFSAPSVESDPVTTPIPPAPLLTSLEALDVDQNARMDTIVATFSHDVTCAAPCTSPWSFTALPTGTTVASVEVSGPTVTIHLAEGTGPQRTDINGAKVALAADPVNGVVDAEGDAAGFALTAPADAMAPLPLSMTSTNGGYTVGVMEPGDTYAVTFSESINPATVVAANVKQADPDGASNDYLIVVGLTDGAMDLGFDDLIAPNAGSIVFQKSTLTMSNTNKTITSTVVAPCTGNSCGAAPVKADPISLTFHPEPYLRDWAGNAATGELVSSIVLY